MRLSAMEEPGGGVLPTKAMSRAPVRAGLGEGLGDMIAAEGCGLGDDPLPAAKATPIAPAAPSPTTMGTVLDRPPLEAPEARGARARARSNSRITLRENSAGSSCKIGRASCRERV